MRSVFVFALLLLTSLTAPAWAHAPATEPDLQLEGDLPTEPTPVTAPGGTPADSQQKRLLGTLTDKLTSVVQGTVLGGYGEFEFHKERGVDSFFNHHRYILFISSQLHPRISAATEFEIEFGGSPRKRDGVQQAGEAILEFSVVDFRFNDAINLRAGILLVPFGAYNLRHDAPTQDLSERPKPLTTVTPTTWFESGAGFFGRFDLGKHKLSYELYAINGLDAKIGEEFGMKGAVGSKGEDNNDDKAIVGRVAWSPNLHLELAASGYSGEYDDSGNRVHMAGADVTAKLGWFELQGEFVGAAIDPGFVEGFSASSPANTRRAVPEGMLGGYLQTNMHFTWPWLFSFLPDDLPDATFTGVLRAEVADTNTAAVGASDTHKLTAGLNFRPIEAYVLKTELQLVSHGAHSPWSGDWTSVPKFVTSIAFLF